MIDYLEFSDIKDNIAIIKINKSYRVGISQEALYEATRAYWRCSMKRANIADYALAVYNKTVVEVYKIDGWLPGGTVPMKTRKTNNNTDRIEFVGSVADSKVRKKYIGKNISHLYKFGEANPVKIIESK